MRLATLSHWQDAGDGVIGAGGWLYPWGDDPSGGICALDKFQGRSWNGVQKIGSQESCVSVFGVYDQLGNLWEWVDVERKADPEQWLAALRKDGWMVEIKDSQIMITKGELLFLSLKKSFSPRIENLIHKLINLSSSIDSSCGDLFRLCIRIFFCCL